MWKLVIALLTLDMSPADALRLYVTLVLALGAHALAAIGLWLLPLVSDFHPQAPIALEVIEAVPEPPPPEPEPVAEPEPEPPPPEPEPIVQHRPTPQPRPTPVEAPPPPEPPAETPPPAEEAVAAFDDLTLTNDQSAAWASAVGSGEHDEAPLGQPGAAVTGRHREGRPGGVPGGTGTEEGPHIAAASDLSRQPGPPADRLIRLLETNYPQDARQIGIEGHADVRIHVHADGRVQPLAVVRETHDGFGAACQRTLRQGGRWTPPLDRQGREVDTITVFRCTFSIRF
jgi:protein TonB